MVVKAIALMYIFDGFSKVRVNSFLYCANIEGQTPFIRKALDKLKYIVKST